MSAADFTPAIRKRIISIYSDKSNKIDLATYSDKTRQEIFKEIPGTKQLRAKLESGKFHTSSLTIEGMQALADRLSTVAQGTMANAAVDSFFNDVNFSYNFLNYVQDKLASNIFEHSSGDFRIPNVPQDKLKSLFKNFLQEHSSFDKATIDLIYTNVQSGHLAGVWFIKLKTALGVTTSFSNESNTSYRDFTVSLPDTDNILSKEAINSLDTILKAVLDADYLSSNLITQNQVFVDATKSVLGDNPTVITELQFTKDNKASGDLLIQAGTNLNKLIDAALSKETGPLEDAFRALVSSLQPLADVILAKAKELQAPLSSQKLYDQIVRNATNLKALEQTLLNTKGSPSIIEAIGLNIVNVIKVGKVLPAITTKISTKIASTQVDTLNIKQVVSQATAAIKKVKAAQAKLKATSNKSVQIRSTGGQFTSLVSLQNILNQNLATQIQKNMGTGSSKNILNYRTGRLAESAKVESMSQSREGMITAFYSYMRNPYGTFSTGGAQESPATRDPKLLISKSIREIGATMVNNRMRAVLV